MMDRFVRVRTLRGTREAEIIEATADERLRVRYLDTGRIAIVEVRKVMRPHVAPPTTAIQPIIAAEGVSAMPAPKPRPPGRSFRYLDFIRAKPCASCYAAAPSDAHHWGPRGMGQKTDDYRTVPLCMACHDGFHRSGTLPGREHKATRYLFLERQVELLTEYLSTAVDGSHESVYDELRMGTEDMMPTEEGS